MSVFSIFRYLFSERIVMKSKRFLSVSNFTFIDIVLLQLCELQKALQSPVFFFLLFFCQSYPGFQNCKSIFLIVKISQYGGSRWWVQPFPRYPCKNWWKELIFPFLWGLWPPNLTSWYIYRIWFKWNQSSRCWLCQDHVTN